jgi:hypothetical protein
MDKQATYNMNLVKTIVVIISTIVIVGITWGITQNRLETVEARVLRLELRDKQIDRIEYNLRRLLEKNGLVYDTFGSQTH